MLAQELIRIKRDGGVLDAALIGALAVDNAAALQRVDVGLADGSALETILTAPYNLFSPERRIPRTTTLRGSFSAL